MEEDTRKRLEEGWDACETAATALDAAIEKIEFAHARVGAIRNIPLYATFKMWGPSVDRLNNYARDLHVVAADMLQRART